jgi:hypothetical protein
MVIVARLNRATGEVLRCTELVGHGGVRRSLRHVRRAFRMRFLSVHDISTPNNLRDV